MTGPAAEEARDCLAAADQQGRNMRWHAAEHHRETGAAWATLAVAEAFERLAAVMERIEVEDQ